MKDTIALGVNIDHVATIRQARRTRYPDPVYAALMAEQAGADSITLHLREDRRHIQDRDLSAMKDVLQTRMNLEMAVTEEMIGIALEVRPRDICLVPERREELTTEGGLDVAGQLERMAKAVARLADAGMRVSLFIDPEPRQLEAAVAAGAPVVELHTGAYADAPDETAQALVIDGIGAGDDSRCHAVERSFFYMPLMHAEDIDKQGLAIRAYEQLVKDVPEKYRKAFEANLEFARAHHHVIEQFGRFPELNEILGRETTQEERDFLDTGKYQFL